MRAMDDRRIESITTYRISNHDYDMMSVEEKKRLISHYRMISLNDPDFDGYWMLIPIYKRETSSWTEYGL
jgi:hypothetical protein